MNSKAPSLCRSPIPAKQLLNGQHSGRCCGLCSQRVLKELNHCASPLRRIDHYVSRFSCASCSNLVGLARFFSRYCGGVLRLFHVVFSIILVGRFFGQPPESIRRASYGRSASPAGHRNRRVRLVKILRHLINSALTDRARTGLLLWHTFHRRCANRANDSAADT